MAYSDVVQAACKGDYHRLCSAYPLHSTQLRRCMDANAKAISKRCIDALVDAGEISKARIKRGR